MIHLTCNESSPVKLPIVPESFLKGFHTARKNWNNKRTDPTIRRVLIKNIFLYLVWPLLKDLLVSSGLQCV